jgi:hypothetical protein
MERWKITGKDGLEVAQCLFEATGVKVTTLPPSNSAVRPITAPLTFATKEQAESLIRLLQESTLQEFRDAKAVRT